MRDKDMANYGDITKIDGRAVPVVDVVIGGSPCQDLSIAGNRAGLAGERSGLFMEQIRLIKEMRKNDRANGRADELIRPRYMVWENVPGALSSNGGEDFRVVLEETARVADENAVIPRPEKWSTSGCIMGDGWSIAWRILDAQFWGVPQRRRRIALIADFGGESAPEILFVRKGVRGDIEESGGKGERTAHAAERGADANDSERLAALTMRMRQGCEGGGKGPLIQTELSGTLACNNDQVIFRPTAYGICSKHSNAMRSANPHSGVYEAKTARTIDANGGNPSCNQGGIIIVDRDKTCYATQSYSEIKESETAASLRAAGGVYGGGSENLVVENYGLDSRYTGSLKTAPTLTKYMGAGGNNIPLCVNTSGKYSVRRLTPLECERLEGYPDGWTDIGDYIDSNGKKRKTSDSARYKALGNSIALPPWKWVLKRISACYERDATMASLFDGIGGFPLLWEQINGKGSCLWTSEIEEFPMAVTRRRFGGQDV